MTPPRELATAVVACLVGAALALTAANQPWAVGEATSGVGLPVETVELSSGDVAPAVTGLALLALAGVGALLATRGVVRRVLGLVIALAGAGIAFTAARTGGRAEAAALADRPAGGTLDLAVQPWAWLAVLGGLAVVAAGVLTLVRGASWPGMSGRYEAPRPADDRSVRREDGPEDLWRALDRGDDPTA